MKIQNLVLFGCLGANALLFATNCRAETTEEMLSNCRPITQARIFDKSKIVMPEDFGSGVCWGAFSIVQEMIVIGDADLHPLFTICAPPETNRTQLIAMFVHYAETHPEKYSTPFLQVALGAIRESFPCKAK